jgi:ABC-type lipoprotein export system ATPase subunit
MYIHRIILRDVRNFDNLDITLYDAVWQKPLNSVLITGPNGSGKTTLLRIIAALWNSFGQWLQMGKTQHELLLDVGLVAMEIRNFDTPALRQLPLFEPSQFPKSIWLYVTSSPHYRTELEFLANNENAIFIGELIEDVHVDEDFGFGFKFSSKIELVQGDYIKALSNHKRALEIGVGGLDLLPNMVFLDTQSRSISDPPQGIRESKPESPYRWLTLYRETSEWDGHIETILANMKLRNPQDFYDVLKSTNQFLGNEKQITDFDEALRLRVQTSKNKRIHNLSGLSAGEQQCLIMMVMVSRWLMPGGVVLIDEPDLHLHISIQRNFIYQLKKIIDSRQGQLIITSHSRTMWEEFKTSQWVELRELEELKHG